MSIQFQTLAFFLTLLYKLDRKHLDKKSTIDIGFVVDENNVEKKMDYLINLSCPRKGEKRWKRDLQV